MPKPRPESNMNHNPHVKVARWIAVLGTVLQLAAPPPAHAQSPLATTNVAQLGFRSAGHRWDAARQCIFISDPVGRRVVRVSLADGSTLASWTAPEGRTPEAISLSPDGHRLAVVLATHVHEDD